MITRAAGSRLVGVFLALFVAVFVLAPSVDAARCGPEMAGISGAQDHDPHPSDGDAADLCNHGHCHHGSVGIIANPSGSQAAVLARAAYRMAVDDPAAPREPDGLTRPPRS